MIINHNCCIKLVPLLIFIVLLNKAADMLLPHHGWCRKPEQSWLPSNHCHSCRKTPTCSLLTVTPQTHKNSLLNLQHCQTGCQGTRPYGIQAHENRGDLTYNCHSESTTTAATSSRCLYTHGEDPRHILNRNVTQHYSHSEITVGGIPLSEGPRIFKKSRSHLQIWGARRVTQDQFHTAGQQ